MVMRDGTRYQCLVCSNSARDMYNSREHMYTHLASCSSVKYRHSFVEPSVLHIFDSRSPVHPLSCYWYDTGNQPQKMCKTEFYSFAFHFPGFYNLLKFFWRRTPLKSITNTSNCNLPNEVSICDRRELRTPRCSARWTSLWGGSCSTTAGSATPASSAGGCSTCQATRSRSISCTSTSGTTLPAEWWPEVIKKIERVY